MCSVFKMIYTASKPVCKLPGAVLTLGAYFFMLKLIQSLTINGVFLINRYCIAI